MQNLGTLRQLFLGDLADDGKRERRKIMPSLMATSLRWRTHSARTKIVVYLSCSAGRTHFARTNFHSRKGIVVDDVDGVIDLRKAQKVKTKMENLNI